MAWIFFLCSGRQKRSAVNNFFFKLLRDFSNFHRWNFTQKPTKYKKKHNWFCIFFFLPPFFSFSASGTSAVAIDNKIEQAMVSKNIWFWLHFRCLRHQFFPFSVAWYFSSSPEYFVVIPTRTFKNSFQHYFKKMKNSSRSEIVHICVTCLKF